MYSNTNLTLHKLSDGFSASELETFKKDIIWVNFLKLINALYPQTIVEILSGLIIFNTWCLHHNHIHKKGYEKI